MALPDLLRKSAEKILNDYCRDRIPPCLQEYLRVGYSIREDSIILFMEKGPRLESEQWIAYPVAQFRYSHELHQWTLHYPDPHRQWRFYLNISPTLDLRKLLQHIDADPTHFFWG